MNLPLKIAKRYLFAKKSHNIINVVSKISVIGIAVCTMAMVIVLSGFNGIEKIVEEMYSSFDPDLKITLKEGKTFSPSKIDTNKIKKIEGVKYFSQIIEETIILQKEDRVETCKIKGVELDYLYQTNFEEVINEGSLDLENENTPYCFAGFDIQYRLGFSSNPQYDNTLTIGGMARNKKISIRSNPLNNKAIQVGGIFKTDSPNDSKYIFTSLNFAKDLLEFENEITSFEVFLTEEKASSIYKIKKTLQKIVGDKFEIKTREEQNSLVFKATKTEKIAVYIILCFVLIIAAFSLVASLTLLILEKRKDVFTLYSIGLTRKDVRNLFFYEGMLINIFGGLIGIAIGLIICYIQIGTGVVPMDAQAEIPFPIIIKGMDLINIIITVFVIGFISSYFPVRYLVRRLEI